MRAPLGRPVAGLTALLLVLAGCSDGQDEDEAQADGAADDLAAALEAGDFADLDVSGATTKEVKKGARRDRRGDGRASSRSSPWRTSRSPRTETSPR